MCSSRCRCHWHCQAGVLLLVAMPLLLLLLTAGKAAARAAGVRAATSNAPAAAGLASASSCGLAAVDPEVQAAVAAAGIARLAPGPGQLLASTARHELDTAVECVSVYRLGDPTGHSVKLHRKVKNGRVFSRANVCLCVGLC